MPDGMYRARDFLDHDGHANRLYQIEVAAIKQGDTLTLDMSESSPQAPGFINCTRSGLRGALFTGIAADPGVRHPLERRRSQARHDQGAGGQYLQRALADAGVGRHGLDRLGRAERRGRGALAHGRRRARIGARGPGRHQGAVLRADHGRRRSRRRTLRHAPDGRHGRRRRRLYRSRRPRRLGRSFDPAPAHRQCRRQRGLGAVSLSVPLLHARYRRRRHHARRRHHGACGDAPRHR